MDSTQSPHEPEERRTRRFPRLLAPPAARRLSPTRLALTAVGILSLFISFSYLGYLAWARSIGWLHQQPAYSVEFGEIVLDPPPPPWFRGGAEAFLKRLSREANHERFSTLDVDLEKLRLKFQGDPLVGRVKKVELAGPRRIVVSLLYREPVAIPVFDAKVREEVAIDEEGALIALADVELDGRSPPLLHGDTTPFIWFKGLDPPFRQEMGKAWMKAADPSSAAGKASVAVVDLRAAEAGELARFIRRKLIEDREIRKSVEHFVIHFFGRDEIFLQCGRLESAPMIRWRLPQGLPYSKSFTAKMTPAEKWEQVRAWLAKHPIKADGPSLDLVFSAKGLIPRPKDALP